MHLLIFITVLTLAWIIRPLVGFLALRIIFATAGLFYREQASMTLALADKLDDDRKRILMERQQSRFKGIKYSGFVVLMAYSHLTAIIIFNILPHLWIYWVVFLLTALSNWDLFVKDISLQFLSSRTKK